LAAAATSTPTSTLFAFRSILLIIQSVKNYLKRPKGKQKTFARFAAAAPTATSSCAFLYFDFDFAFAVSQCCQFISFFL